MLQLLFLFTTSLLFTPIAIWIFLTLCDRLNFKDDSLNGLTFYRRQGVAVYVDKHGNKVMVNRNKND